MSVITKDTIQPSSGQALTIKDEGGTASITVATNGEATFAENIVIGTAGKGIDFSAQTTSTLTTGEDTSAGAELFDHYEKGEWTPSLTCGTSGTMTIDPSYDNGEYIKIGDLVWINCHMRVPSANVSTPAGELRISGLPFARRSGSGGLDRSAFVLWGHLMGTATGSSLQSYLSAGSTTIRVSEYLDGNHDTSSSNNIGAYGTSEFNVTGCYIAG